MAYKKILATTATAESQRMRICMWHIREPKLTVCIRKRERFIIPHTDENLTGEVWESDCDRSMAKFYPYKEGKNSWSTFQGNVARRLKLVYVACSDVEGYLRYTKCENQTLTST